MTHFDHPQLSREEYYLNQETQSLLNQQAMDTITIRYNAKSSIANPFDNSTVLVVSTMVDKNQLLDAFTMDELIAECNRRHKAAASNKLVKNSEEVSIFFDKKETDFTMVGDFNKAEARA